MLVARKTTEVITTLIFFEEFNNIVVNYTLKKRISILTRGMDLVFAVHRIHGPFIRK